MHLPSFHAAASLYPTRGFYRGGGKTYGNARNAVLPQLSCQESCDLNQWLCQLGNIGSGWGAFACYVSFIVCVLGCPDDSPGGPPVGPAPCCPSGKTCSCGGTCVSGQGCVDGTCLGPNQKCP